MITVKLSHSILSAWSMGRQEDAIGMYLGKSIPVTPAMELGKAYDSIWNGYIDKTSKRPKELGGGDLRDPITQQKYSKVIPFSDDYQILIRGVPDLVHKTITLMPSTKTEVNLRGQTVIDEHKCGRTSATDYIERYQLDYYKLLIPNATMGVYRCYNPYFKSLTVGVKFLSDENAERALNHILTYGGEMIEYLAANKLIKDFKEV